MVTSRPRIDCKLQATRNQKTTHHLNTLNSWQRLVDGRWLRILTSMERAQYCVYNQTSECFLSLGVTHGDRALARIRRLVDGRARRYDEGQWIERPRGIQFFRIFSSRDLVFLDDKHCVIGAIESFPPLRFVPFGPEVASALVLPEKTIVSSQTQQGNKLVICVAEELEFRLRSMPDLHKDEVIDFPPAGDDLQAARKWNAPTATPDRRTGRRKRWRSG